MPTTRHWLLPRPLKRKSTGGGEERLHIPFLRLGRTTAGRRPCRIVSVSVIGRSTGLMSQISQIPPPPPTMYMTIMIDHAAGSLRSASMPRLPYPCPNRTTNHPSLRGVLNLRLFVLLGVFQVKLLFAS